MKKSPLIQLLFYFLMIFSFTILQISTFKVLKLWQYYWLLNTCYGLFGLSMVLSICVWQKDPGYLEKMPTFDFVTMLETFENSCICPECEVIRTPRSRHCNLCNRCVDRFDHHCPWVNTCIGRGNFHFYYAFLVTLSLFLCCTLVASAVSLFLDWNYD